MNHIFDNLSEITKIFAHIIINLSDIIIILSDIIINLSKNNKNFSPHNN